MCVLKCVAEDISHLLSCLLSLSLECGVLSEGLKFAKTILVGKSGDRTKF